MLTGLEPPEAGKRQRRTVRSMHSVRLPKAGPRAVAEVTVPDPPTVRFTSMRRLGC